MPPDPARPLATYRLQLHGGFRLADATALVPYLTRLGVTHVYASPVLRSRGGSTHGYDVVDPATLDPDLGDEADFRELTTALGNHGLRLILDIVPNHMAAAFENPYWRDVLTYGPASPFAHWFDINWRMADPNVWGRVLVPVLGHPLRTVLERDEIRLQWADGRFVVRYYDHRLPVDPATVPEIFRVGLAESGEPSPGAPIVTPETRDLLEKLARLPKRVARMRGRREIDRDETERRLARLAQLIERSPRTREWAEEAAERFGAGLEGRRRLEKLLDAQPYRLVYWRAAARVLNYRRFFDIDELVALRQENPRVLEETHATIRRWCREGRVDGLRIDHVDGLRNPREYLERLAAQVGPEDGVDDGRRVRLFVEKILAPGERLPETWPVEGTTGYDFLNEVERVFVSPSGFAEIVEDMHRLSGRRWSFEEVAGHGKRRVLRNELSPHVRRLADMLQRLAQDHRKFPRVTGTGGDPPSTAERRVPKRRELAGAIVEYMVGLPVYRTYVEERTPVVRGADRRFMERALAAAAREGHASTEALELLGDVLLLGDPEGLPEHVRRARVRFMLRLQQITGAAAAKGVEDTALYAWVPLVSLNEVGGEPLAEYVRDAVDAFHRANAERAGRWPRAMLAATTHDTKRTADVRARLDVLSEIPGSWTGRVRGWHRRHRAIRSLVRGKLAPDPAAELLFYQTAVGIWPAPEPRFAASGAPAALEDIARLRERVVEYMIKAVREAKTRTSWVDPREEYERALRRFVTRLLDPEHDEGRTFLDELRRVVGRVARAGFWNALAREVLRQAAPGTPDIYRGDELWDLALVDPDNRRPVDFDRRRRLLDEVILGVEAPADERRAFLGRLVGLPEDGRIKLHAIHRALAARRERPEPFACGDYVPLRAEGDLARHVVAFARVHPSAVVLAVAPRLTTGLPAGPSDAPVGRAVWAETSIPLPATLRGVSWTSVMTRESIDAPPDGALRVGDLLARFPADLWIASRR